MPTRPAYNLKRQFAWAVVMLLACMLLPTFGTVTAESQPDAQPNPRPNFYDPSGIYSEAQRGTLERDASLLQSSKIPTVVYARTTTAGEAQPDQAQIFAEMVRKSWQVETSEGADDGLVLLYSHVPENPRASTVVVSYGSVTFTNSGLTPDYLDSILGGDVRALLNEGHPFEALVYGMREIRYGGIYFAPPPTPLSSSARALQSTINVAAPLLLLGIVATYVAISLRRLPSCLMPQKLVWKIVALTGLIVGLVGAVSIIGRSRIGIASALLMLVALAIQIWLWTHPSPRQRTHHRVLNVPPTVRRIRMLRQARHVHTAPGIRK